MSCLRVAALTVATFLAAQAAQKQPVYVYLYSRIGDHVNVDLSEDRLRRILPMLDKYKKQRPESGVAATILVSGAMSEALAASNGQTGILDFVKEFARRGVIEMGYEGTDEPTYQRRPVPIFSNTTTSEQRWSVRSVAVEKFLAEWRDPLTGVADPGKTGGLKKMQEIFGEAACITGVAPELGGDSEMVHILSRYNQKAIAFGIPDPKPEMNIHGFRGSAVEFTREMAPTPETSPELYWQDNILRSSDTSDASIRAVGAYEGPETLKALLAKMDRSRVRIIHVEIGALRNYLRPAYQSGNLYPPLKLAYDHPEAAKLPAEARVDDDEIGAAYAKEEALVRWLAEDFFPANRGSRFISSSGLKEMTPPSSGFTLTLDELKAGTKEAVEQWGGVLNPPPYLRAGGRYLSLAESFQVMADVLAELSRTGKLPASVRVAKVYGPISMPSDHGANVGAVSVASVARVCAGLVDRLHDQSWKPIPNNMIPPRVTVEGYDVNAGVFWRLMTRALLADSPDAKVPLKMTHMFSLAGQVFPKTRLIDDQGATWTYKPAPLQLSPDGGSAH